MPALAPSYRTVHTDNSSRAPAGWNFKAPHRCCQQAAATHARATVRPPSPKTMTTLPNCFAVVLPPLPWLHLQYFASPPVPDTAARAVSTGPPRPPLPPPSSSSSSPHSPRSLPLPSPHPCCSMPLRRKSTS